MSDPPLPVSQAFQVPDVTAVAHQTRRPVPGVRLRFWAHPWNLPTDQVPDGVVASPFLPRCSLLAAPPHCCPLISGLSASHPTGRFPNSGDTCKVTFSSADSVGAQPLQAREMGPDPGPSALGSVDGRAEDREPEVEGMTGVSVLAGWAQLVRGKEPTC